MVQKSWVKCRKEYYKSDVLSVNIKTIVSTYFSPHIIGKVHLLNWIQSKKGFPVNTKKNMNGCTNQENNPFQNLVKLHSSFDFLKCFARISTMKNVLYLFCESNKQNVSILSVYIIFLYFCLKTKRLYK